MFVAETFDDDVDDIDYQGKKVNRETYEDNTKTNKGDK